MVPLKLCLIKYEFYVYECLKCLKTDYFQIRCLCKSDSAFLPQENIQEFSELNTLNPVKINITYQINVTRVPL